MHQFNDEWLLMELRAGNEQAFNEIYRRYHKQLHLDAYYRLRDLQEAEDVMHDVFASLWKRRKELSEDISLKHYLFRALRNKCVDRIRKLSSLQNYMGQLANQGEPHTHHSYTAIENKELASQIRAAINAIPFAQRRAFEMLYIEAKSHKEIVAETGTSLQTVKNNISTALKALRKKLQNAHNG